MDHLKIKDTKTAFFLFVIPIAIFCSFALIDFESQFMFNRINFIGLLVGLVIYNAIYNSFRGLNSLLYFPSLGLLALYIPLVMAINSTDDIYVSGAQPIKSEQPTSQTRNIDNALSMDDYRNASVDTESSVESQYFAPDENLAQSIRVQFGVVLANKLEAVVGLSEENPNPETIKEFSDFGSQLGALIKKSAWYEIERLVEEHQETLPSARRITANLLLMFNAPFIEVSKYIQQGAEISASATLSLVKQGRVDELLSLENIGVNFNEGLPLELILLDMALMAELPHESFEFLVQRSQGSNNFKSELGVDTLAIALLNAEANPQNIPQYINSIISTLNFDIKVQHIKLFQALSNNNPELANNIAKLNQVFIQ